ncbi:MAG: hypothetical protein U0574_06370 [Phycisphaerales bacterium]
MSHSHHVRCAIVRVLTTAALLGAAAAGGCAGPLNQQDGPLGDQPSDLPDLAAVPAPAPPGPGPATTTLDRSNWPVVTVRAPRRQVETEPYYFEPALMTSGSGEPARNGGAYPDRETVLQGPSRGDAMAAEAVWGPFWTAGELVMWPVRMVGQPPWVTTRQPIQEAEVLPPAQRAATYDPRWTVAP